MKTALSFVRRGLPVTAAALLFACSGTRTPDTETPNTDAPIVEAPAGRLDGAAQDPQDPAAPQDPRGVSRERRQFLIEQGLERARRSLELRLYRDALRDAAQVLELAPDNEEARQLLLAAQEVLGDDVARVTRTFEDRVLEQRVRIERTRFRARQAMQRGDALVEVGRYGDAIESYETAQLILRYEPMLADEGQLGREIEQKLEAARQLQAQALTDARAAEEARSREQLAEAERRARIEREQRVTRLLVEANRDFQLGNYRTATSLLEQALHVDPNNARAMALHDLAARAHHENQVDLARQRWKAEWVETFQDLRESNVPQVDPIVFDIERWAEVAMRQPLSFTPPEDIDSPERRAIEQQLEQTVIEHNFPSATIDDWASFYSRMTDVNFVVAPSAAELDETSTTLTDFRLEPMSVQKALDVIARQTGVKWTIRDGAVMLVSSDTPTGTTYLLPYGVTDLVTGVKNQPGPKLKLSVPGEDSFDFGGDFDEEPLPTVVEEGRLERLIRENIAPESWDEGIGTINPQNGVLLIRHTREVHEQIAKLLSDLRRAVGIQVDVEARFLKVEDSFLEDIGVDFRGLGDQSSEGLQGRGLADRSSLRLDDFGRPEQINTASPGEIGTGTDPGIFFDDGGDGDYLLRTENLYDNELGGGPDGLNNAGGLSLQWAYLDDTEVEVILRAVQKQERSEEIIAPRLLVYNNTRAHMQALRHTSYIKDFDVEIAQAAAVANPMVDVVRDGVVLDVRPVVSADRRFITMELRPTVVSLQLPIPTFTTTLGAGQPVSIQLPNVTLQQVRTTVTMPDGGTLMLGGMKLAERQNQISGVPLLKDLPGLSFLFSRKGSYVLNRKVLILIRAQIVISEEHEPLLIPDEFGALLQDV